MRARWPCCRICPSCSLLPRSTARARPSRNRRGPAALKLPAPREPSSFPGSAPLAWRAATSMASPDFSLPLSRHRTLSDLRTTSSDSRAKAVTRAAGESSCAPGRLGCIRLMSRARSRCFRSRRSRCRPWPRSHTHRHTSMIRMSVAEPRCASSTAATPCAVPAPRAARTASCPAACRSRARWPRARAARQARRGRWVMGSAPGRGQN